MVLHFCTVIPWNYICRIVVFTFSVFMWKSHTYCRDANYFLILLTQKPFFLVNGKHKNVKNKSWTVYVFLSAYWIVHQQFHYVSSIVLFLSLPSSFFSLPTSTLEFRVTKIFLLPGGNWPQQRSDFCAVLPCVSMISAVYHPTTWWYSFDSC